MFDSPHSGGEYPDDFDTIVPMDTVRRAEDMYVDELFAAAPEFGAALLAAHFPRSYIDPNRASTDIDPQLVDGRWPGPVEPSEKARFGHGLIWRICPPDLQMYDRRLTVPELRRRIEIYYRPYHQVLRQTLDALYRRFGKVWQVNCHSMPSISGPHAPEGSGIERADFVLGDRDGTTCSAEFVDLVRKTLEGFGYGVRVNDPYKGVEIVRAYSDPARERHSLQIEINRALYMNETTFERREGFGRLRDDMTRLIGVITDYSRAQLRDVAAE